jgi:hypothetical protein
MLDEKNIISIRFLTIGTEFSTEIRHRAQICHKFDNNVYLKIYIYQYMSSILLFIS